MRNPIFPFVIIAAIVLIAVVALIGVLVAVFKRKKETAVATLPIPVVSSGTNWNFNALKRKLCKLFFFADIEKTPNSGRFFCFS